MTQYRDYEQQVMSAQRPRVPNFVSCNKCKCEWFEQFQVSKFDNNLTVAPGQQLPASFSEFTLLRCVRCGDIQEISTSITGWDRPSQDRYTALMDDLEAKPEESKPVEEKK